MYTSKSTLFFRIIAFVIIFVILEKAIAFLVMPAQQYTRLTMHEMYEAPQNADIFFIGSSATLMFFAPYVFDEILETNSINIASASELPVDSYYVLKEALKYHNPSQVILGFDPEVFWRKPTSQLFARLEMYDYFKPSLNKYMFGLDAFSPKDYPNAFLSIYRYRNNFSFNRIFTNTKNKLSKEYQSYSYQLHSPTYGMYKGKGFVYREHQYEPGSLGKLTQLTWSDDNVKHKNVKYFDKIASICKEKNIELILISIPHPIPNAYINEDGLQAFFEKMTYGKSKFYNFDLVRPEFLQLDNTDFADLYHVSGAGAEKFSRAVAYLLKQQDTKTFGPNDYFYSSYDETLASKDYVFNTWLEVSQKENELILNGFTNQADHVVPEIKFSYRIKGEDDFKAINRYSQETQVRFEPAEGIAYEIRIDARAQGSKEKYEQYCILPWG